MWTRVPITRLLFSITTFTATQQQQKKKMLKMICRERSLSALKMADEAFTQVDDEWEIIDPSDDEDSYSFNDSTSEDDDDHNEPVVDLECRQLDSVGSPSPTVVAVPVQCGLAEYVEDDEQAEKEDDDEDDDDDGGDDLDDELVPYWVNDRLVRQRMIKFGKKAHAKVKYAKRPVYHSSRPGCVQGKHGLGLKHRIY